MPYTIEPIPKSKWGERCNDSDHEPPQYVHVPKGFQMIHRCPSCGKSVTILNQEPELEKVPYTGDPLQDQRTTIVEPKGISVC